MLIHMPTKVKVKQSPPARHPIRDQWYFVKKRVRAALTQFAVTRRQVCSLSEKIYGTLALWCESTALVFGNQYQCTVSNTS
jgi:hypothetical protein